MPLFLTIHILYASSSLTPATTKPLLGELKFATPNQKDARKIKINNDLMFTIWAKKDPVVSDLTIIALLNINNKIVIYTRNVNGEDKTYPMEAGQWTLVYSGRRPMKKTKKNGVVNLDDFCNNSGVRIKEVKTRSFYVYGKGELMYIRLGNNEGTVYG